MARLPYYAVAGASEYLAITRWNIHDITLAKKALIFPGQTYVRIVISPVDYTVQVQAMSADKQSILLPAVFTIGPKVDDEASLVLYTILMSAHDMNSKQVNDLVQGIIEEEIRVLAASMTMEEIFKDYKNKVSEKVQLELDQFGLIIYYANVKQLVYVKGHEYFSYLSQKTRREPAKGANQAKIDVSEAGMKAEIEAKLKEGQTTLNAANIDAETKIMSVVSKPMQKSMLRRRMRRESLLDYY
ncbi:flotillin-like protein 3 [Silene latifolia]|uniref:flotillin-like protein 3 n=1 Tax=Silene latifolia TaxID=37657 RepID=UPI003D783EDD